MLDKLDHWYFIKANDPKTPAWYMTILHIALLIIAIVCILLLIIVMAVSATLIGAIITKIFSPIAFGIIALCASVSYITWFIHNLHLKNVEFSKYKNLR